MQLQPFLKWAGGKSYLLPELIKVSPLLDGRFYSPFLGAGALFLHLQPSSAHLNDLNWEIINCFEVIRDDVELLLVALDAHQREHSKGYYYQLRQADRDRAFGEQSVIYKAARTIYLNKTCYNGMFRQNKRSEFNTPIGNYSGGSLVDRFNLINLSRYLQEADLKFTSYDFSFAVNEATAGDFVYLDPPYHGLYDGYTAEGFDVEDQLRLRALFNLLASRGCYVLMSNRDCNFIRDLYAPKRYRKIEIVSTCSIGGKSAQRGVRRELLIANYDIGKPVDLEQAKYFILQS